MEVLGLECAAGIEEMGEEEIDLRVTFAKTGGMGKPEFVEKMPPVVVRML